MTERNGVDVGQSLAQDLVMIIEENSGHTEEHFPKGSFRRVFWDQQLEAAKAKDPRQMRWHPCVIRWCLNLKLLSSSAYHALRTSGFIKLPSERTLSDYTHFIKSKAGFHDDLDRLLVKEASLETLPDWKKHVVLVLDEMKMKESLVYEGEVIGFLNLGDVNDRLAQLERNCSAEGQHPPVANHVLAFLVRGISSSLQFPYVQRVWMQKSCFPLFGKQLSNWSNLV